MSQLLSQRRLQYSLSIFVAALAGVYAPKFVKRNISKSYGVVRAMTVFAGGVCFAIGVCSMPVNASQLLAEGTEGAAAAKRAAFAAQAIAATTFACMYIVEVIGAFARDKLCASSDDGGVPAGFAATVIAATGDHHHPLPPSSEVIRCQGVNEGDHSSSSTDEGRGRTADSVGVVVVNTTEEGGRVHVDSAARQEPPSMSSLERGVQVLRDVCTAGEEEVDCDADAAAGSGGGSWKTPVLWPSQRLGEDGNDAAGGSCCNGPLNQALLPPVDIPRDISSDAQSLRVGIENPFIVGSIHGRKRKSSRYRPSQPNVLTGACCPLMPHPS
eukprot:GHVU01022424.1.p1 GENE.GHVU01022424.1~~GHVU01022424.1.p1  ORF type:complete len:327 (+),score=46.59 GHVU01022424.1:57-1037(+)